MKKTRDGKNIALYLHLRIRQNKHLSVFAGGKTKTREDYGLVNEWIMPNSIIIKNRQNIIVSLSRIWNNVINFVYFSP